MQTTGVLWCSCMAVLLGCGEPPQERATVEAAHNAVTMWSAVRIDGGAVTVGHDGDLARPEESQRTIVLRAYEIDQRPVSNAEYLDCVHKGICPDECQRAGTCSGAFYASYHIHDPSLGPYPASTVTIAGAEAYCRWLGKRLPTNAEWERAARGGDTEAAPFVAAQRSAARGGFSPPLATSVDDRTNEGVQLTRIGVPELVADPNAAALYQPAEEPATLSLACAECPRTLRGNISMSGTVALDRGDGKPMFPVPVWMTAAGYTGGFRCARTVDGVPDSFLRTRQALLSGQSLGGVQ